MRRSNSATEAEESSTAAVEQYSAAENPFSETKNRSSETKNPPSEAVEEALDRRNSAFYREHPEKTCHSERSSAPGFAGRNGVEESLTETRAEAVGAGVALLKATASAHGESAILHSAFVAKPPKAAFRMTAVFF